MTATTQTQTADAPTQESDGAPEAVEAVVAHMTAGEIRSWMSENGLTRSRGARKMESAEQAYEQDAALVEEKAAELEAELPRFLASCPNCDLEERFDDAGDAEEAARSHKSGNPTHFPRAADTEADERLYG